jgi:hypothetical protein
MNSKKKCLKFKVREYQKCVFGISSNVISKTMVVIPLKNIIYFNFVFHNKSNKVYTNVIKLFFLLFYFILY